MRESGDPAVCPGGHRDTVKLLTTVAVTGTATAPAAPVAGAVAAAAAADVRHRRSAITARPSP